MRFVVLAIVIGTALGAIATGILILLDAVDRALLSDGGDRG